MANVAVGNNDAALSGKNIDLLESDQTITGLKTFSRGAAAPFAVAVGSLVVTNLDAEKVGGTALSGLAKLATANAGNLIFTDATYDIGASGATRPRDGFFSRNVTVGGTLTNSGLAIAAFAARSVAGIAAGVTTYYGSAYDSTTETDVKFPVPSAGTIKNLYVQLDGSPGGAETFIFTARKNGSDQTVTCTVSAAALTANDTTHSFTVVAGDLLAVKLVTSGGASTRKALVSYQLVQS